LTLVALTAAIASVVALLGISRGFSDSFAEVYASHGVNIVVTRQGSADRLSSSLDASFAERIESLDSVDRAAAVLLETLSLEEQGIYGIPSMGVVRDSWLLEDYELVDRIDINDAESTSAAETSESSRNLMLGIHLADRLGLGAGATVSLFGESYLVRAVFRSRSTWENGSLILPLELLQTMTDRAGQATFINVIVAAPHTAEPLSAASLSTATLSKGALAAASGQKAIQDIQRLDSKLLPMATADFVATDARMQLASAMAWMTSVIALVIGAIGTLNTMLTSVMERTKEIGILRAIGWPKKRVVSMILWESCGLAVLASCIGTLLAIGLTWGLSQAPAAKGILSPVIDWRVALQGFLLALSIGLLGAILPAWRAINLLPTDAFREG
jgi:putative ABC transport system permease protein